MAVAAVVTTDIYPGLSGSSYWWWLLVIPLAAAVVVLLRPRLAAGIVPLSLIVAGLAGVGLARVYVPGGGEPYRFGLAPVGDPSMTGLILAQAYLVFLTGGWLAWRELAQPPGSRPPGAGPDGSPGPARAAVGPAAAAGRRGGGRVRRLGCVGLT